MRLFPVSVFLLLVWGALAVGGSPSSAAAPVAVFAVATGLLGFLEHREGARFPGLAPKAPHLPVSLALCLLLAAIGVQLVPLPESIVWSQSPSYAVAEFEKLLATADRRDPESVAAAAAGAPGLLSIAPARTFTLQMPGAAVMLATPLAIAIHHPRPRTTGSHRHAR